MLRSLCFVSLNLPACHICSTLWLMFIYLTRWSRQLKWRRDENACLSKAKHHLSILISATELPTLADKVGENSGDLVSFNSPNRTAKKKRLLLRAPSQHPSVCLVACMRFNMTDARFYIFHFLTLLCFFKVAICFNKCWMEMSRSKFRDHLWTLSTTAAAAKTWKYKKVKK